MSTSTDSMVLFVALVAIDKFSRVADLSTIWLVIGTEEHGATCCRTRLIVGWDHNLWNGSWIDEQRLKGQKKVGLFCVEWILKQKGTTRAICVEIIHGHLDTMHVSCLSVTSSASSPKRTQSAWSVFGTSSVFWVIGMQRILAFRVYRSHPVSRASNVRR